MATLYTRTYTFTGQSNFGGACRVELEKFTVSGDTTHEMRQIKAIRFERWHTSTGSNVTWNLMAQLVLSDGTLINSDTQSHKFNHDVYKFVNEWTTLPTPEQFDMLSKVQVVKLNDPGEDLYWRAISRYPMYLTVEFYEEPPVVYAPRIEKFKPWRVNSGGADANDGNYLRMTLRLSLKDSANAALSSLKLYYAANAEATQESAFVSFTAAQIAAMLAGEMTLTLSPVFMPGNSYDLLLAYSCGEELSLMRVPVPRAFATLHLSPCSTGGVAIGGFSGAAENDPKFEVVPPSHLYGGLRQVGNDPGIGVLTALGVQSGTSMLFAVGGGSTATLPVSFELAFSGVPAVVAGMVIETAASGYGACSCTVGNITQTGFSVHACNNSGSTKTMKVSWIAVGPTANTAANDT